MSKTTDWKNDKKMLVTIENVVIYKDRDGYEVKVITAPLQKKILNMQAKEDHPKNAQNSEIAGQQPKFPA